MFKWFVIGIIFVVIILPIIDMLMEVIGLVFEIIKGKLTTFVLKENIKIADLQTNLEPQMTSAIGFQAPDDDYYYDDYDDCDDKLSNKNKLKIGF